MTREEAEELQQMVRDLRDADEHVCPEDEGTGDCSCGGYDEVIDRIEEIWQKTE